MASLEEVLTAKLSENGWQLWRIAWSSVASRVLARSVVACFDFRTGGIHSSLPPINDLKWRVATIEHASDLTILCENELMYQFDTLNSAIVGATDSSGRPYTSRTKPRMRSLLRKVQSKLVQTPASSDTLATVSVVEIWRATADEVGRGIFANAAGTRDISDCELHNRLLVAGYFWACNLTDQRLVTNEWNNFSTSLLSIQGTLVDIVERVSTAGIEDRRPIVTKTETDVKLKHQHVSPLVDLLVKESHNTANGNGFLMRWLGAMDTPASRGVDPVLMRSLRLAAYTRYEHSVLSFATLSAIEQLLRTFAHRAGIMSGEQRFTPQRLNQIVAALGGGQEVQESIESIYDYKRGNLRNRILHGAQLQIERSQQQAALSIVAPWVYREFPDALSPNNVFNCCWNCLRTLDEKIASVTTLASNDFSWTEHFLLSSDEVHLGTQIHNDFTIENGTLWWNRIDHFLTAVTPNIKVLFDIGLMGWVGWKRPDRLLLFMAFNMILEALFRASIRIQGRSIIVGFPVDSGIASFRYKMLDRRELCSPETLDKIVETVASSEREVAKTVLTLAVKIRDAVAHGAILDFGVNEGLAMGHLLVKAMQCLVEAGEHEMIKTAAFYRSQKSLRQDALANWAEAEREIMDLLQVTIARRADISR